MIFLLISAPRFVFTFCHGLALIPAALLGTFPLLFEIWEPVSRARLVCINDLNLSREFCCPALHGIKNDFCCLNFRVVAFVFIDCISTQDAGSYSKGNCEDCEDEKDDAYTDRHPPITPLILSTRILLFICDPACIVVLVICRHFRRLSKCQVLLGVLGCLNALVRWNHTNGHGCACSYCHTRLHPRLNSWLHHSGLNHARLHHHTGLHRHLLTNTDRLSISVSSHWHLSLHGLCIGLSRLHHLLLRHHLLLHMLHLHLLLLREIYLGRSHGARLTLARHHRFLS